ncbi:MAG: hypothetical protein ACTHKK_02795 [Candidatus Nitrosocosmicus sp.]
MSKDTYLFFSGEVGMISTGEIHCNETRFSSYARGGGDNQRHGFCNGVM